eukprot:CAMPEP_0113580944 /NCGR_PEP_ID=MMETSP0015_2-20120614/30979_1 /TAXON_ID=2838 /ORGANISM="Odontella" /LENGTH=260 /DNA_ID=CAMNT_0000485239 /DNA_START=170 /DNA_END=949 /DNA_ORIENTATION=+ /assembly_acc=CAM_ASM_000160
MSPTCRAPSGQTLMAVAAALMMMTPLAGSFRPLSPLVATRTVRASAYLSRSSVVDPVEAGGAFVSDASSDERPRDGSDAPPLASLSRRNALGGMLASTTLLLVPPPPADAAQTAGEAVRRSAANLPGYGQADVFYPPHFRGAWRATREVIVADDDSPPAALLPAGDLPATIVYDVRFVSVDGDGPTERDSGGRVVADRGYNERSYREAIRAAAAAAGAGAPPAVRDSRWDASNPNVLTLTYADGSTEEIRVTKRAAEVGQ